jgi:dienelactone hydrolase
MAASMPCKNCVSGLYDGTPTGTVTTLHGLPTYVAEPPSGSPKGIIVIIPDAFGWELSNTRVLADRYAKRGAFRVYVPDFMNGT